MGAEFDFVIIEDSKLELTNKEIREKAKELFEEIAYKHGHGGYSGTLAEKISKLIKIHRKKQFETLEDAEDYVRDVLDTSKWENSDVVPIKNKGWFVGGWCSS